MNGLSSAVFAGFALLLSVSASETPAGSAVAGMVQASDIDGKSYDLVVVEATPGGVAMAVRAAREGLRVLLVNHTQHLGGMLANGLGVWDTMYDGHRSPVYDELRESIFHYYRDQYGETSPQYTAALPGPRRLSSPRGYFEPHVAELMVDRLVARERNISVLKGFYPVGVERAERLLRALELRELKGAKTLRVTGAIFADASYEGDLAAVAKVPYRVGREARSDFDEPHAGIIFAEDKGSGDVTNYPRDAIEGRLNLRGFRITTGRIFPGGSGEGDGSVQAYNYRLCLTSNVDNRILPDKPDNYRREDFLGKSSISAGGAPNAKGSWNEGKLPGQNQAYPDGDWAAREAVMRRHLDYSLGWIFFAQNDESIPPDLREKNRRFGLPKDEFADNGHVPYEIYVREARRLVGRFVFTEHDAVLAPELGRTPIHADSVAVTEWPMDSHECTDRKGPHGGRDGKVLLTEETRPAQVPYRCLLSPEVDNLLVPVCLSATHVGWGAIRLEPTWMNIAESAGYAAALAVRAKTTPAQIESDQLLRTLVAHHVMVSFFNDIDVASDEPWVAAAEYFATKGFFHDYNARPGDALNVATGKVWADGLRKLSRGELDPSELARAAARAEAGEQKPMTEEELGALLPSSPTARGLSAHTGISRGKALAVMFSLLPPSSLGARRGGGSSSPIVCSTASSW